MDSADALRNRKKAWDNNNATIRNANGAAKPSSPAPSQALSNDELHLRTTFLYSSMLVSIMFPTVLVAAAPSTLRRLEARARVGRTIAKQRTNLSQTLDSVETHIKFWLAVRVTITLTNRYSTGPGRHDHSYLRRTVCRSVRRGTKLHLRQSHSPDG